MAQPFHAELIKVFSDPLNGSVNCPQHCHHFFQLDVILEGTNHTHLGNESPLAMQAGYALLIPPLVKHGYSSEGLLRQCAFKFSLASGYWAFFGNRAKPMKLNPTHLKLARESGNRCREKDPFALEFARAVLVLCLTEFAAQAEHHEYDNDGLDTFRRKLWPILEQVKRNPSQSWTVGDLAGACNFQVDYFARCFRKVLRLTPQQYLLENRMTYAAEAIQSDRDLPLKEVAESVGYSTIHSFTRAFTRVFGVSPAAYRRQPEHF